MTPQCQAVLRLLSEGPVTGAEAATVLKCRHLPRRIADLKEAGFVISSHLKRDIQGQRYASYQLEGVA